MGGMLGNGEGSGERRERHDVHIIEGVSKS